MSNKKVNPKTTKMFSLKNYLKKKATDKATLLQQREEKRQNKPEALKLAKKMAKLIKTHDTSLDVTEEVHEHGEHCGHDHT